MTQKRNALGRGLAALLGDDFKTIDAEKDFRAKDFQIDMDLIELNPFQPRLVFKEEELQELADSITKYGVIQPILVRRKGQKYQLIAGERRLQASKKAGHTTIPAVIREVDDQKMFEIAIIENVQRENLNPIEEAEAYHKLMDKYDYTQVELAKVMGKSRSYVANSLRLLNLTDSIRKYVVNGKLSLGHAKVLASYAGIEPLAKEAADKDLSVRELEEMIKNQLEAQNAGGEYSELPAGCLQGKDMPKRPYHKRAEGSGDEYSEIAQMLSKTLQLQVKIESQEYGKRLIIDFDTLNQLDQLIQKLNGENLNF